MGDSENVASKKRVAGRQISKENPELDDDGPEPEMGTFKKASDEVLATRRIVKVRRSQPAVASSNPFASLGMVPPSDSIANATTNTSNGDEVGAKDGADENKETPVEGKGEESGSSINESNGEDSNKKVEEKTCFPSAKDASKVEGDAVEEETPVIEAEKDVKSGEAAKEIKEETEKKSSGEETEDGNAHEEKAEKEKLENANKDADGAKPFASLSSFHQLSSSQNAFTGFAGTGFGTSSPFSFGSVAKEGAETSSRTSPFSFGSITKEGAGTASVTSLFSFGSSSGPSAAASGHAFGFKSENPSSQSFGFGASNNGSSKEVPIETGEENEKAVFAADAILYEYSDGGWKERGKGELKLNISLSDAEKARLVMRARGNYRLILNACLYPDMTLTNMDKKGVTFACINSAGEGNNALSTFALKFKDSSFAEEFRGAVAANKGKKNTVLKTPENSPIASDG
ncbi:uncharacterized protein A4U43_C01F20210 [Asparagus officinalis]|uniref:RanBD1 domain-containing protein n=1 Tax=Asparagus officinalis TaxID=4686 RepID=A0A5P1FRE5_ASPOF|nr:nuclear pore complex protein NUP50A-like [Asparagus officinalis]XP_020248943.1 nuclear pore complex protein NUP50A-like [Asparagus officinalis]XP_020248950.1 nuclear pore complex protein NUP50A-like [Asparagus officinalis]ONK80652.1 uncharacterized protein A4U43_C01F20210 [Asparagus officinalis]